MYETSPGGELRYRSRSQLDRRPPLAAARLCYIVQQMQNATLSKFGGRSLGIGIVMQYHIIGDTHRHGIGM